MTEAPIVVVPYDAAWVGAFERERELLQSLLAPWLWGAIEHIGSTAVVGLCAKPVIDTMVGVRSLPESFGAIEVLRDAGYQYSDYKAEVMHWLCKPSFAFRTHHLHLVPFESPLWRARLTFRDALRASAELRAEYAALKLDLARRFEHDREAYTDAKTPFIDRVLASR